MKLKAKGHNWHAEIHQNRPELPWLVMLHGFMGCGYAFSHLISDLVTFCNPVTVDLPGHGKSSKQSEPGLYETHLLVDGLASVLRRLQMQPLFLHGYSMGGRLALRTACLYPQLVNGLILESTSPGIRGNKERSERVLADRTRAEKVRTNFQQFLEEWHGNTLFSVQTQMSPAASNEHSSVIDADTTGKDSQLVTAYRQMMAKQNPASMAAVVKGFSPGIMPDSWNLLAALSLPVCLITGESDSKYVKLSEEMDRHLPESTCHVIKGASHRIHLDNPSEFIKLIQTFIQTPADS